jgi:pyruvate dehydrogenase E1 component beta subunit
MKVELTFAQAIHSALASSLEMDESVRIFGLGVADVKGVFGTTSGLANRFGKERVFDIPLSENAVTGAALGMAMMGLKPVMTHQRADFSFTSAEQIINQVSKTYFTSGGKFSIPMVIRMIVGRGWGQGPTHAQSPHALFATVPGLKVVMPATPEDAFSMMINAIRDPNPVLFIEHRWLHEVRSEFSTTAQNFPLTKAQILRKGTDVTLAAVSYGVIEALKVASVLEHFGISTEVVNIRSVLPLDQDCLVESASKTRRFASLDIAPVKHGLSGEITKIISDALWGKMECSPLALGLHFIPVPSSPHQALNVYISPLQVITSIDRHFRFGIDIAEASVVLEDLYPSRSQLLDQPDVGQVGPF